MKVHIIVLNYNGEKILKECLPSIIKAASFASCPTKVTVLDNQSTDQSWNVLQSFRHQVSLVRCLENKVLCSYNDFIKKIDDDIVILLNNDIKVRHDFVDPIASVFQHHADACFVATKSYYFDGKTYEGNKSKIWIKWGLFGASCHYPGYEKGIDSFGYSMQAGILAFDRQKFLLLGGYDDLFLPGRLEDSDICYRAWKQGFKGYYEPKSVIYHKGGASFHEKFGEKGTLRIAARNTFLFMWKNVTDPRLLVEHVVFLGPRILFSLLKGKTEWAFGFFMALPRLSLALKKRKEAKKYFIKSDREVLSVIS